TLAPLAPLALFAPFAPFAPTRDNTIAPTDCGRSHRRLRFRRADLEVTWTRVLAMTLGPTTYAFSAMLVAFIAGLAIGSAIAAALVPRTQHPGVWLGVAMMTAAATTLLASSRVDQLPLTIAATAGRAVVTFTSV